MRDYNVCPSNADGRHGPIVHNFEDYDIDPGYVSVRCEACGESTGHPIAAFADDLEWN
jgi:hypothetical protein